MSTKTARRPASLDEQATQVRKSLTLAQRSALSLVCAWGGVDRNGLPSPKLARTVGSLDMRTLFALCVRGLLAGGPDAVLRPTDLGQRVRE